MKKLAGRFSQLLSVFLLGGFGQLYAHPHDTNVAGPSASAHPTFGVVENYEQTIVKAAGTGQEKEIFRFLASFEEYENENENEDEEDKSLSVKKNSNSGNYTAAGNTQTSGYFYSSDYSSRPCEHAHNLSLHRWYLLFQVFRI